MSKTKLLPLICLCFLLGACQSSQDTGSEFLSPQAALETFELAPGFQMELVAAEPLVSDPVDMCIDEFGQIYVVEMHGYPLDLGRTGKIKLLKDSDGDGRPDQSVLFADSLLLPTGIMRWKQGVIVTDPPEVLYFEDTDGDGKADKREVLLTGFALSNPQHNLNNPEYGLDNWVYLAHEYSITTKQYQKEFGDEGAEVYFPNHPEAKRLPKNAEERGVRFKPDTKELEMLSGATQFGHAFDLWGRYFAVSNYDHLFHEVIAARYLERNPDLLIQSATQYLPGYGPGAEVFPITQSPEHQLLTDVGVMTSACGTTSYLGGLFPAAYQNVIFTAEPVHNLVHTDILEDKGATFTARQQFQGSEFLASTDAWFRPVNFYIGPDGALFMLDYYRKIIEHPEWMSEEVNQSGQLYEGDDLGRIYRISPSGTPAMGFTDQVTLGNESPEQWVDYLGYENIWWRMNAQRLLVDQQDNNLIEPIRQFFHRTTSARGKLHALWTLEGLGHFDPDLIRAALLDNEPGLRANAIQIAELHLQEEQGLETDLLKLKNDPNAKVRYQLLCTLGFVEREASQQARLDILSQDLADEWVQIAALSGFAGSELNLLLDFIPTLSSQQEGAETLIQKLSALVGFRNQEAEVNTIIKRLVQNQNGGDTWWKTAILEGLSISMQYGKEKPVIGQEAHQLFDLYFKSTAPRSLRQAGLVWLDHLGFFAQNKGKAESLAASVAFDSTNQVDFRRDALMILAWTNPSNYENAIRPLIDPSVPQSLQQAALFALSTIDDNNSFSFIIEKWSILTPELRNEAIDLFMKTPRSQLLLLEAIKEGQIQAAALGWRRTVSLLNSDEDEVRDLARKVLEGNETNREEVVQSYQEALKLPGNAAQGLLVFEQACAQCHLMQGKGGIEFGPDLSGIRNRSKAAILRDILEPNRSIADGYELWLLEKENGEVFSGMIAAESPNAITLRDINGVEHIVPRSEIMALTAQEHSAMPPGLESQVGQQEMADLLAYLKNEK